jgi:hypothetical protein
VIAVLSLFAKKSGACCLGKAEAAFELKLCDQFVSSLAVQNEANKQ